MLYSGGRWSIEYYSDEVARAVLQMPPGLLARYVRVTELMEEFGGNLGSPHTRAMGGKLFELRLKAREGLCRVFYCVRPGRRIVMLHMFVKKGRKTPAKELRVARHRLLEVVGDEP
jgi:phage-related protein